MSAPAAEPTGRRRGIVSLLMVPAILVSFTVAELAGFGVQALLGLEEGEMLRDAGALGVLAGVVLTLLLVVPQVAGIVLGLQARRLGERRLGTAGVALNAAIAVYAVLVGALGLILG